MSLLSAALMAVAAFIGGYLFGTGREERETQKYLHKYWDEQVKVILLKSQIAQIRDIANTPVLSNQDNNQ